MLFPLLFWAEICLLLLCQGCQLEEPVIGLNEAVKSDRLIAAAIGGEANFYCNFSLSMEVLQVTWQKRIGSSFQNLATYSLNHGPRLIGSFQEKARFTRATLKASAITLQNLTFEDESFYRCIFNVFPYGSFSKDICLNIHSVQRSIISMALFTSVVLLTFLLYCTMRQINRRGDKQKRCCAPRTLAEEESLHRDLSEKAGSLHTLKDQHIAHQNEEQTPGSSLHKPLPYLKRNPVCMSVWGPDASSWAMTMGLGGHDCGDTSERNQLPATGVDQG
ncbi:PREDICTED: uncharacterized protein LOC104384989 [Chaetura pelagica]|uniref:uncharacterized protein LOC104384989 n=1 Tax=Chaetura pelagica TaxID=8897 RepID=UPI000523DE68|nr:PREDICTED: uncharacterized protein LOC104384989 [Chaetura pelagica]